MSDETSPVSQSIYTIPNQITAARIVLSVVVFVLLPLEQYLAALIEIPFAGEPSDLVDIEQDPGSATDIPPEIEEESTTNEDQITVTSEEGVESGELFTTQDGIVEIPITGK